jgi:hypothetical protein
MRPIRDIRKPTFAQLVERLEAAGLHVGLELSDNGRHAITVVDPDATRSIRMPVSAGLDQAAAGMVLSGRLRESLGLDEPDHRHKERAGHAIGRWPEFTDLWPKERAAN